MKKSTLLIGAAIGYVFGTRAGQERYEQIKDAAGKARRNPRVQSVVDDAKSGAAEAAKQAGSKVADTVSEARHKNDPAPTAADFDVPPPGSTS